MGSSYYRRIRGELGFSRRELAVLLGIPVRTIERYERGDKGAPAVQTLYALLGTEVRATLVRTLAFLAEQRGVLPPIDARALDRARRKITGLGQKKGDVQ